MSKLTLPGLIDIHVHLRTPGQEHKEDFFTGTSAALAGGFTKILDMPNNKIPITTKQRLQDKIEIAKKQAVCDVGFYFGSLGDNLEEFNKVTTQKEKALIYGLKLYLNETTGNFLIHKKGLKKIFSTFSKDLPILLHAEEKTMEDVIEITYKVRRRIHFCHISTSAELKLITKAKENGLIVTCGITPHHLFLTEDDVKYLGSYGQMKPPLKSKREVEYLWKHLREIDVIESDHAPHTLEEKESNPTPYGVPGLETTLPLLLTAVNEKRLTIEDVIRLCCINPAKIFGTSRFDDLNHQSKIQIDPYASYTIENKKLFTKCGWSPFNGWKVKGKVKQVFIRETKVFENDKILVKPGFGKIL